MTHEDALRIVHLLEQVRNWTFGIFLVGCMILGSLFGRGGR